MTNSAFDPMEGSETRFYPYSVGSPPMAVVVGLVFLGTDDRVAARGHAASEPIAVTVHAAGGVPRQPADTRRVHLRVNSRYPTLHDDSLPNCVEHDFRRVVQIEFLHEIRSMSLNR